MKTIRLTCCVLACFVSWAQAQVPTDVRQSSVSWFELPVPESARECGDEIKAAAEKVRAAGGDISSRSYREDIQTQPSSGMGVFFDINPTKYISAFQAVELNKNFLELRILSKGRLHQYQGPVVNTVKKEIYGASPQLVAIQVFSFGLTSFVLATKRGRYITFGCSDEVVIKKQIDGSKSVATGKSIWKDAASHHTILVSGLGKDYEYRVEISPLSNPPGTVVIDLGAAIDEAPLGAGELVVLCKTCIEPNDDEKKEFSVSPINNPISFNFLEIKEARRLAAEQLALNKKTEEDRKAQEQRLAEERQRLEENKKQIEADRIARLGDGSVEDIACQKKSLKPLTPAYAKCRTSEAEKREKDAAAKLVAEEKSRIAEADREAKRKAAEQVVQERKLKEAAARLVVEEKKRNAEAVREATLVAAKQAAEEKRKAEEAARVAKTPPTPQNEFTGDGRLSLDTAKKKCIDLGFKPSTEGFGKCVIQLSR